MTPALRQVLSRPGWVLPYNPSLQIDFAGGRAWKGTGTGGGAVVPPESLLTVSRASVAYQDDLAGNWREWPANTLRFSNKGALIEEARTNLALWCRDLTNAVWAKVTMTTALTATGINGTANSATTVTSTDGLATILQTVVQLSTADTVSLFVRRRTGTGTVEITADGAAFTNITAALAAAASATPGGWYRAVVSATLVNPVLGLRITTSGDAVDVDFAQLEAGTFATSPIRTTAAAVTRAADFVGLTLPNLSSLEVFSKRYTFLGSGIPSSPIAFGTNQILISTASGTSSTDWSNISRNATTGLATTRTKTANVFTTSYTSGSAWAAGVSGTLIQAIEAGSQLGTYNSDAVGSAAGGLPAETNPTLYIGAAPFSSQFFNGHVTLAVLWKVKLPSEVLRDLKR